MWQEYAIILIRGIGLGSVYALIAMSFNIVKVSSGILNFAQGNMFVLGGMLAYAAVALFGQPSFIVWLLLIPVAAIIIAVVLLIQGYLTLLPLSYSDDQQSWLITTMAVSIIIGAVLLLVQGPNALMVRSIFPNVPLFGMRVPAPFLLAIGLAVFWYVVLQWFLSKTLTGLAISALWQDPVAGRAAGLKVRRLQLLAFGLSGLIIGSTGFVAAPIITIASDSAVAYVLNGFVALVIGGVASNTGALIAGPLVGVAAMLATFKIGGEFQGLVSMLILVGILLIRPEGIFGSTAARRV
ncbi:branched-chain amino acid ABC transporter permease [Oryzicola mucosus]|uniref:Branched-chain amino acid ABC transporter permease n=1 Tax=Oryzicola mucosus TaxID=2767425 RepID=A0A8J6PN08_9HYPH|nr:branched-chain amino acid ABC transporter permease [Oryzicola mucosus]MBD0417348.1 branched-chain amino acid ABC transporter permease [Oryzicola mucosus]